MSQLNYKDGHELIERFKVLKPYFIIHISSFFKLTLFCYKSLQTACIQIMPNKRLSRVQVDLSSIKSRPNFMQICTLKLNP